MELIYLLMRVVRYLRTAEVPADQGLRESLGACQGASLGATSGNFRNTCAYCLVLFCHPHGLPYCTVPAFAPCPGPDIV
jgi:hypothetical protein